LREIINKKMRHFILEDDWHVVVGKSDIDNDFISLHFSEPEDYWFHVEGCPGSHVLLLNKPDEEPHSSKIRIAAEIAAYYSKAKNASKAIVGLTKAKNVSKQKGSPAGQVLVKREKSIKVEPKLPEA
jgi:predicted ribosome quality control (RQC) complex YloA/Tae2 family protein